MYDIRLINMPFANLHIPSLGLTQLRSVVRQQHAGRADVHVHYLNHDFAHFFTMKMYRDISALGEHQNSGIGDWLFRQAAFPEEPDNFDEFFQRYYPASTKEITEFRVYVAEKRAGLVAFLDELVDKYDLASADMVGLTSMFAQSVACFALAQRIKERNPATVIVIGGANCETPMGEQMVRGVPQVDFVFSGPALRSFPELVGCLLDGDDVRVHRINGVFSRRNVDKVMRAKAAVGASKVHQLMPPGAILPMGQELNVNANVELDYDSFLQDVELNFPDGGVEAVLPFETSRGCWWGERAHCTFCGLNSLSMNFRSMASENALSLLRSLFERYGDKYKQYICVDNIMPREYVTEVFANLEAPEGATIFYEVKADFEDHEIAALAKAGVTLVQPGIESLATSTLKLMKKGVSSFRNVRFLQSCLRHDVYPTWNLLVGFPNEDPAVYPKYVKDLPLLTHLPPPTGVYPVRFDRYSPYFNEADQYGLDLEPLDFYNFTYPFEADSLRDLAYYFVDRNYEAEYFSNMVGWLDKVRRLVLGWQMRWHGKHHTVRPQLHLTEDENGLLVFDSRSGTAAERRISEADRDLLLELLEPKRPDRLKSSGSADPAEQLARFRRYGWIFQDGPRVLSVVMPEPPPTPKHITSPVADFNFDVDVNDLTVVVDPMVGVGELEEDGRPALVAVSRSERRVSRTKLMSKAGETSR
ncbi:RiPP maturation radical SAM C-methyltransferase [Lentzea sp. NPDC034063]|uniref:RiPP maturation radical SAM C-methyltransferase n=1 Tax=unclassified Lentzea TaxID=2643253 RepID=UPI0033FD95D8